MHRKKEAKLDDFNTQEGDFLKALRVENLELRTVPKHYMTRGHTTIKL